MKQHAQSIRRAAARSRRKHSILTSSIAAAILAAVHSAPGASFTWDNGAANSLWDTASLNWTGVAWPAPGADNDAVFGAAGAGAITIDAGGITANDILFSAAGYTIGGGALTLNGATNLITTSADATISATIDGTNGFTKIGASQLTLNGAASNIFTGTTIVSQGTLVLAKTGGAVAINGSVQMGAGGAGNQPNLRMGANEQFGAGVVMTFVNPAGSFPRFDLQGTTQTLAGIVDATGAGVTQNERLGGGGTAAAGTLTLNGAGSYSYNGYLRDEDDGGHVFKLNIVKNGDGTQLLSGSNINYQGTTTVNSGTLELTSVANFASAVTINGGTLKLSSGGVTGTAFTANIGASGTLTFSTANAAVDVNRFQGAITGTGTIVKEGTGWYHTQGGAMANFAGTISVMQGRFGNAFNTSVWTNSTADAFIATGAELDLRTDDIILDELTGSGNVVNTFFASETNTLTVGVANGSSVFDGQIRGNRVGANNTSTDVGLTALRKVGTGSFTLTNVNSNYSGPTTADGGTLVLQSTRLVAGAKAANGTGILEINSTVPFATRWNNSGTISGNGTINKTGSGVFGTTGAVNFSGVINILEGRIHNDNVTGNWTGSTADVNVSVGAVLDLRANDMYVDELNGTGEVWNSHPAGGGDVLFVGVANGSSTFDGNILGNASQGADNPNGAVLSLTKQGSGTFTVTGGGNIYSGATTVNNGVLRISGGDDRLPLVTNLTVNGGATFGGTFDLNGLNQTVGGISGTSGAVAGLITSTTGPATLTANVAGANVFNTAATIAETGGHLLSLTKSGTGTQALSGANTYSGPTLITGGALRSSSAAPFSPNSNIQLDGGVIEAGFADLAPTTGTGGGQVQWIGSGGFSAAGAARNITVNGGATLTWNAGNFVPTGSRLLLGSATADNTATLTNSLDLAGGTGTVEIVAGPAVIEGELSGAVSNGTLFVRGNQGALALTGQATAGIVVDNSNNGSTNIMNLLLNRAGGDAIAGGLQIGATSNNQFATVRLGSSDQIADSTVVTYGAAAGSWSYLNLYGFNDTIAGLSSLPGQDGGVVQLVESDGSPATNSTLTLNVTSGTQSYLGHIRDRGNGITNDPGGNGRLGFIKDGAGTQELTTWNQQVWSGATTVNSGTLKVALNATQTLGFPTLNSAITNHATLEVSNAGGAFWTVGGPFIGAGNVVKSGAGIVNLAGAGIAYTGPTTVNSGILRLTDQTAFASSVTVNAGAWLEENRTTGSGNFAASVAGAGGLIKQGDGESILTAPLTVAQAAVRRGTLTAGADNVLTSANTLSLGGSTTMTFKLNGTTQTVGGLGSQYDFSNRIIGGSPTASSLTVNIAAGQQNFYGGKLGDAGLDEGNFSLTKTGDGTLMLGTNATYTGGTVIAGGTLQLGASLTMPVNLATLGIWLDGADPDATGTAPADGSPISVWKNKGALGAAGDFVAQPGREPAYGATGDGLMNGNASVRFTATPIAGFGTQADYDKLVNPINLTNSPATIIVAGRYAGASADERKRLVSGMANNWLLGWWNNGENAAYYVNGFAPGISAATTNPHVYTSVLRGDGIGETYGSALGRMGTLGNAAGPNGLALGGGANYVTQNTENSTGDIGELIIVPSVLSDADRGAIEAYLVRKWTGFAANNPLPVTGAIALTAAGTTLAVNGVTQTAGSISGVAGSSITLGGGSLTVGNDGGNAAFAGVISGAGALAKTGFGTWTLSGANTYTATTRILDGVIELSGGANRLPTGTTLELGSPTTSGTLKLNGNDQTIAGLTAGPAPSAAASRVINDSPIAATLTVNLVAGTNNYSGKLGGATADENNLALRKEGAGKLVLTQSSTYTGTTVITAGTIQLGGERTPPVSAAIWLDATDGATINTDINGVLSWANKGTLGAAGDFAPVVFGPQQPEFVGSEPAFAGNPTIRFSSITNDRLQNALDFPNDVTVAYIGRLNGGANERLLSAMNNNWLLGTWGGNQESAYFTNGFLYNAGAPDGNAHFFMGTIAAGGAAAFYSDGTLRGTGTGAGPNGLRLGGGYLGTESEYSDGDIGELFVFNGVLSDADRSRLESYIARKWLNLAPADILPTGTAVTLTAAGAKLDVNGVIQTVGSIDSVAGSEIALGGGTLTAGGDGSSTTIAGSITGGDGTFIKEGAGTLRITGPQDYAVLTTNDGTTNVKSAIGTGNSILNANAATNLGVSQTLAELNIGVGATVTVDAMLMSPALAPVQAVPEPGAFALLLAGALGTFGLRRSERRPRARQ